MQLSLHRARQVQFNSVGLLRDAAPYVRWAKGDVAIVGDGARLGEWSSVDPGRTQERGPYVFTMGRLVHKKGFDQWLKNFK